jgi:hypothetical protein
MIDQTDYPCYIDSIKLCPTGKKCVGTENCDDKNCPLVKEWLENGANEIKEGKEE